ncbi:MAG: PhoH family protein [Planctomycetes bacterium]|nr:PhoH family protein [Planctomycetota bacterium]
MERVIKLTDDSEAAQVFGVYDRNLKVVRDFFGVRVTARGSTLLLQGESEPVSNAGALIEKLAEAVRNGGPPPEKLLDELVEKKRAPAPARAAQEPQEPARSVACSKGQQLYLDAMERCPVVFAIGPAGTGKTFLAVRMAVDALKAGTVSKLVLCRPAVEAGEKLGFLPGDFQAKINPYLRPLYDALNELLDFDQIRRYTDREIIEVVPLAYMRGRTLNRSFIILDEAQNTTNAQMKMFLTRMGNESRIVVTGDITQVDLPEGQPSGLLVARRILRDVAGLEWIELGPEDIVRHPMVSKILAAYDRSPEHTEQPGDQPRGRPRR